MGVTRETLILDHDTAKTKTAKVKEGIEFRKTWPVFGGPDQRDIIALMEKSVSPE